MQNEKFVMMELNSLLKQKHSGGGPGDFICNLCFFVYFCVCLVFFVVFFVQSLRFHLCPPPPGDPSWILAELDCLTLLKFLQWMDLTCRQNADFFLDSEVVSIRGEPTGLLRKIGVKRRNFSSSEKIYSKNQKNGQGKKAQKNKKYICKNAKFAKIEKSTKKITQKMSHLSGWFSQNNPDDPGPENLCKCASGSFAHLRNYENELLVHLWQMTIRSWKEPEFRAPYNSFFQR